MLARYLSLVLFAHTVFALPFALVGLTLGLRAVDWAYNPWVVLYVVLCMVFARSAAMGFNRWADRALDARNARTQVRDIPAGRISARAALVFVALNCALFIGTTYLINPLCFYLSPVALAVVLGYSYTKRFTPLCHLVLGVGLGLAPVGAYIAVTEHFAGPEVLLGVVVLCWVAGFDIIYALQDEAFDRANGLLSIPSWLGGQRALAVARALHVLSAGCLAGFVYWVGGGVLLWAGAVLFASFLVYQHRLVTPTDLSRINRAFFTANGYASVVFGALALADLLWGWL